MPLPDGFSFSQSSLQDYLDCPRRFELKYILNLFYPALETEPALERERHMLAGQRFHTLIQQAFVGIPVDALSRVVDAEIRPWWNAFLDAGWLEQLPLLRFSEYTLHASLNQFRLTATFDLIAIEPGEQAIILDWKTIQHPPKTAIYRNRLQTRLYSLLLALTGNHLNQGIPIDPDRIKMTYWFSNFPDRKMSFQYSQQQMKTDLLFFENLTTEIQKQNDGQFLLTTNEKLCAFCNYRSLCGRGTAAGDWHANEEDAEGFGLNHLNIDLDQIGEIVI